MGRTGGGGCTITMEFKNGSVLILPLFFYIFHRTYHAKGQVAFLKLRYQNSKLVCFKVYKVKIEGLLSLKGSRTIP